MKSWKRKLTAAIAAALVATTTMPFASAGGDASPWYSEMVSSCMLMDEEGNSMDGATITMYVGETYPLITGGKHTCRFFNRETGEDMDVTITENDCFIVEDIVNANGNDYLTRFGTGGWWREIHDENGSLIRSETIEPIVVLQGDGFLAGSPGEATLTIYCFDRVDKYWACEDEEYTIHFIVKERPTYKNPFEGIDISKVENPFSDVSKDDWYYDYVMYLYAAGFYEGMDLGDGMPFSAKNLSAVGGSYGVHRLGSSTPRVSSPASSKRAFSPDVKEHRANTVTQLYNGHKGIGGQIGSYTKNKFTDVFPDNAYYQPVLWATATKTVNGYGGGLFGPLDGITREQFCAILVRYAQRYGFTLPEISKEKTFKDAASISSYAVEAVSACQKAGIINGMTDGTFCPKDGITRAQAAAMIYRFMNNCIGGMTM